MTISEVAVITITAAAEMVCWQARLTGPRGELQTQYLEADWENITFLALYSLPPSPDSPPPRLTPYTTLFTAPPLILLPLYTHTQLHGAAAGRTWDSPACVWVWWVVCSGRSSCGTGRRRCTGSVQCCRVSTEAWRWRRSSHTHGPLRRNTEWHLWNQMWQRVLALRAETSGPQA